VRVPGGPGPVDELSGGTDAPNLGFPALVFGPGALLQAHSTNEYVAIDDVVAATRIYLATALDLLTGQRRERGRTAKISASMNMEENKCAPFTHLSF